MDQISAEKEKICNGIRLFFLERGQGDLTFLCIHNTGGDHQLFIPQLKFFLNLGEWWLQISGDMEKATNQNKNILSKSLETILFLFAENSR